MQTQSKPTYDRQLLWQATSRMASNDPSDLVFVPLCKPSPTKVGLPQRFPSNSNIRQCGMWMGYHCHDQVTKDHDFCLVSRCSLLPFQLSGFDEENCHAGEALVGQGMEGGLWPTGSKELRLSAHIPLGKCCQQVLSELRSRSFPGRGFR